MVWSRPLAAYCIAGVVFVAQSFAQSFAQTDRLTELVLEIRQLNDLGNAAAGRLMPQLMAELAKPHPNAGMGWNQAGVCFHYEGDTVSAERAYKMSVRLLEKQTPATIELANALLNLAGLYLDVGGRTSEAEKLCLRAMKLAMELRGSNAPILADYLQTIGAAREQLGDEAGAREYLQRALAITEDNREGKRRKGFILGNLATLDARQNNWRAARDSSLRAVEYLKQCLAPTHPDLARAYLNLARIYEHLRQWELARQNLELAERTIEGSFGLNHPLAAEILTTSATVMRKMGRSREARALDRRAKAIVESQPKSTLGASVHVSDLTRTR